MAERRWPEHLDSVIEEFDDCFDSMERYELLFEFAKKHPSPLPPDEWNEENQVHGCQSRAHVECCLLYTSPSPRDLSTSRMPSSA